MVAGVVAELFSPVSLRSFLTDGVVAELFCIVVVAELAI
jgi:hypothetical protein